MTITLLLYNLKLNILIFSTTINSSLYLYSHRPNYAANYRNALDRLRVCMNIILLETSLGLEVEG